MRPRLCPWLSLFRLLGWVLAASDPETATASRARRRIALAARLAAEEITATIMTRLDAIEGMITDINRKLDNQQEDKTDNFSQTVKPAQTLLSGSWEPLHGRLPDCFEHDILVKNTFLDIRDPSAAEAPRPASDPGSVLGRSFIGDLPDVPPFPVGEIVLSDMDRSQLTGSDDVISPEVFDIFDDTDLIAKGTQAEVSCIDAATQTEKHCVESADFQRQTDDTVQHFSFL